MKHTMVLGMFSNDNDAEKAINHLKDEGYKAEDMSLVMKDKDEQGRIARKTGTDTVGGAIQGATTGSMIGGLAGLLTGLGVIAIPGVGPFLAAGPIATALGLTGAAATTVSGAATGAAAGGLIGALTSFGLSADDAKLYEQGVNEGGILLAVPVNRGTSREVIDILEACNADQIKTFNHDEDMVQNGAHHRHAHM